MSDCQTCAPKAWDYPPRGGCTASCGHYASFPACIDWDESVAWWDWDEWGDLVPFSASFCPPCALALKVSGRFIPDHKFAEAAA